MSGLYNIMFGLNTLAPTLLTMINLDYTTVARFRDCFLNEDGSEIIVYTRTGGGNRSEYEVDNQKLSNHPGCIGDEDDSFDSTYALFRFEIPEEYRAQCKEIGPHVGVNPAKRWQEALATIGKKAKA